MQYLDFDLEIGPGRGRTHPIAVRSSVGEVHASMRFPFDEVVLRDYLKDLQIALLRSGGLRRRILSSQEQSVQDFGQRLFDALLSGKVLSLYDQSRMKATHEHKGLRLRLHIQAPELAALPWEYLYDARQAEYVCLSRHTPIVRYLDLQQPIQPLMVAPPLSILGMVASPRDQGLLDVEHERERIDASLKTLEDEGLIELTWLAGQTWRDLQRAMRSGPWHIFHFIGHGDFDENANEGLIALVNDQGRTHALSATELGRLLANHQSLRLVVLNSCRGAQGSPYDTFSSTAATLMRRGIPAVLAMQEEITDRAAIECTRTFYEALVDGLSVEAAMAEARVAISLEVTNTLEWGTPVLYLRSSDSFLFTLPERSRIPQAQPIPSPVPQKNKEQLLKEGDDHAAAEHYEEALVAYEQALRFDPNTPLAYQKKSTVLRKLKRHKEALDACQRAINLDPKEAGAYLQKGEVLLELEWPEEALIAYEQALQANSRHHPESCVQVSSQQTNRDMRPSHPLQRI